MTIIGIATLLGVAVLAVRTLLGKLPGSRSDKQPRQRPVLATVTPNPKTPTADLCWCGIDNHRRNVS